jgi:uncharacterized protein with HXXEE motif
MRQAVWLFPMAYGLHVLEELPNFTAWAQRYASANYTMREYLSVHAVGLLVAVLSASVISVNNHRVLTFIFFTFIFTPAVFFNVLFHAGATVIFRVYCPGLITATCIYAPLFMAITYLALRERLMTHRMALTSFMVAGLVHAADLAHNVFKTF